MDDRDFLPVGQTDLDLGIDLVAGIDQPDVVDVRKCEGFAYPALLISGIRFNDTLRVLQAVKRKSYRLFDVWVDLGDGSEPVKQGTLPLDVTTLLTLRYLGLRLTIYFNEEVVQSINLNDLSEIEAYV